MTTLQTMTSAAHYIQRTLGTRRAAGYLRNCGISLAYALFALTGSRRERGHYLFLD